MRKLWITTLLACFSSLIGFGQEIADEPDTRTHAMPDSIIKKGSGVSGVNTQPSLFNGDISSGRSATVDSILGIEFTKPHENATTFKPLDQPGTAFIHLWRNGGILATGNRSSMPGLMQIDSGNLGLMQDFGNFSIFLGGMANKYGFFNGLHTQYGVGGHVSYHFSPRLSIEGYGTYYFGNSPYMPNGQPMTLSMLGYYNVSTFGGYVSYQFNETFGMDVGGQAVQQFGTNRYRFEPIVTPTVKIGKVKIGLPVGQVMNGIIRSQGEGRRRR